MVRNEALEACLKVVQVLEQIGVDYLVGGSLASSAHGIPRSTNAADLVADLRLTHVPLLVAALEKTFYLDADRIRHAVRQKTSFNVIFLETMFKVDVFVLKDDALWREEMRRRQRMVIDTESRAVDVASAEDTVLQKLAWYREGGGTSDRQWQDLLGVLKVRRDELDRGYLRRWASVIGVEELLGRAFAEAS